MNDEAIVKVRRLINLQTDTILKSHKGRTEIWAVMGAGALLLTVGVVVGVVLARMRFPRSNVSLGAWSTLYFLWWTSLVSTMACSRGSLAATDFGADGANGWQPNARSGHPVHEAHAVYLIFSLYLRLRLQAHPPLPFWEMLLHK